MRSAAARLRAWTLRGAVRSVLFEAAKGWRPLMPLARHVAAGLAAEGRLRATRKGAPVDPVATRGPIRLRLG